MSYNYEEVYGQSYLDSMNSIREAILSEQWSDKFHLYTHETGLGKSFETNKTLRDLLKDESDTRKFLIVKKFNEDSKGCYKFLKDSTKIDIDEKVLVVTSFNYSELDLNELKKYKIVFISHARYIMLCEDEEAKESFLTERKVVVVDEKINFPVYTYDDKFFHTIRGYFENEVRDEVDKVCKPLNEKLKKIKTSGQYNEIVSCGLIKIHHVTLANFKQFVKDESDNIQKEHKHVIKLFIKTLELIYSTKSFYYQGAISTFNRNHKIWGLDNGTNILLDASAGIDGVYKVSDKFIIHNQERIIDHSDSKFIFINFNSSKSNIIDNEESYFSEIGDIIKNKCKEEHKVLIVCHKDNRYKVREALYEQKLFDVHLGTKGYNNQRIAICWFSALIGNNSFSDFEHVFIIGTPNIPMQVYLQYYMQYAEKNDLGRKDVSITKGKFQNELFRDIQEGYVASEIYQCLKRVQRVPKPKGYFWVVTKDESIINKIKSVIKGINEDGENKNTYYVDFKFDAEKKQENKTVTDKLLEYLEQLPIGEYTKEQVAKDIEINKAGLARYFKKRKIQDLLPLFLEIKNKSIVIREKPEDYFVHDEDELEEYCHKDNKETDTHKKKNNVINLDEEKEEIKILESCFGTIANVEHNEVLEMLG